MNNLQEMPNLSDQPNVAEVADDRKKRAKEHFRSIKTNAVVESRSSLLVGYHANCLKKENLFGILGFGSEDEARQAAGVGRSTWYSTIRIAEAFEGLPEELFTGMKLSNAVVLADMPESKRLDRNWVQKASDEKIETFARLVDEEMHGKARSSDTKERSVKMAIDMPASRKTVIESKVKEFAEAHNIEPTDTGKVIEAMAVEATGGSTLLNTILHVVERARKIRELVASGLSADEVLIQVVILNDENILECATALEVRTEQEDAA